MDKQFVLCLSGMQGNLRGAVGLSLTANAGVHCSASLAYSPDLLPILKNHKAVIHDAPRSISINYAARPARAIRTRKADGRKGLISISDAASPAWLSEGDMQMILATIKTEGHLKGQLSYYILSS